jgi:crossover junction endodeoxyribonuclease RusA
LNGGSCAIVSHYANKEFVHAEAAKLWSAPPLQNDTFVHLTLVHICGDISIDTDNIIKPVQDALIGLVYFDDNVVKDVECHQRPIDDNFDIEKLPSLLRDEIVSSRECVYVKISLSKPLEEYLCCQLKKNTTNL